MEEKQMQFPAFPKTACGWQEEMKGHTQLATV